MGNNKERRNILTIRQRVFSRLRVNKRRSQAKNTARQIVFRLMAWKTSQTLVCPLNFAGTRLPCKFVPGFLEKASFLANSCQLF